MARKTVRSLKQCIADAQARKQEKLAKGEDTTQEDIEINKCAKTLNHTRKQRKGYKQRVKNQSRQKKQNQKQKQVTTEIIQPIATKPELVLDKTGTLSLSPVRYTNRSNIL